MKRELNNAVLVLLDSIIYEATHKNAELEGNDGEPNFDDFVASLSNRLESAGIKFKFVKIRTNMLIHSQKMFDEEVHPGPHYVDYVREGVDVEYCLERLRYPVGRIVRRADICEHQEYGLQKDGNAVDGIHHHRHC